MHGEIQRSMVGYITKMSSHQRNNDIGYMWQDTEFSLRGAWPSALRQSHSDSVTGPEDRKLKQLQQGTCSFFLRREG